MAELGADDPTVWTDIFGKLFFGLTAYGGSEVIVLRLMGPGFLAIVPVALLPDLEGQAVSVPVRVPASGAGGGEDLGAEKESVPS